MNKERAISSIIGFICGDIQGSIFEGMSKEKINFFDPKFDRFYSSRRSMAGEYTDDSELVLFTMLALINNELPTSKEFKYIYSNINPNRGYGSMTRKTLLENKEKRSYFNKNSNGLLMRTLPISLKYYDNPEKFKWVLFNSAITTSHISTECIEVSLFYNNLINFIVKKHFNVKKWELIKYLEDNEANSKLQEYIDIIVMSYFHNSLDSDTADKFIPTHLLEASFTMALSMLAVILSFDDPSKIIETSIRFGGDTDTVAAIASSLGGLLFGNDIFSNPFFKKIENYQTILKIINLFQNHNNDQNATTN